MAPVAKKRKVVPVEEVLFDEAAREQYLTGFHKRKQQRIKHAQETVAKREREERIKERKEMREQRQKQLEEHVKAVNLMLRDTNGNADIHGENTGDESATDGLEEWGGFEEPLEMNRVDEYIDEGKYATVTVESVDVSKEGLHVIAADDEEETGSNSSREDRVASQGKPNSKPPNKRVWTKEKPTSNKPKKRKKFRYESVAERKLARQKQKARNAKAAQARRG